MRPVLILAAFFLLTGCGADESSSPSEEQNLMEVEPLGPEPAGDPTRYPIVLGHGFDASPTNRWGFNGVAEALRRDGHRVYVAIVPPYHSPAVRARALALTVDRALAETHATKVNLIAHSMGGLDARELIS